MQSLLTVNEDLVLGWGAVRVLCRTLKPISKGEHSKSVIIPLPICVTLGEKNSCAIDLKLSQQFRNDPMAADSRFTACFYDDFDDTISNPTKRRQFRCDSALPKCATLGKKISHAFGLKISQRFRNYPLAATQDYGIDRIISTGARTSVRLIAFLHQMICQKEKSVR